MRYVAPWARLRTSMTPKTRDSPSAMTKSRTPKASPSTIVTALSVMTLAVSAVTDSLLVGRAGSGGRLGQLVLDDIRPLTVLLGDLAQVVRLVGAVVLEGPRAARAVDLLDALQPLDDVV